jgi:site-specific DNA recombinase
MRAALYARFSTDLQNPRSADDQLDACRTFVERQGGEIVMELKDEATSGASIQNRPGVQALLATAKAGACDAVVCEALDRLSRDLADIAMIEKRLKHYGVKLITLSDGEVNKLHVGLRGTMNALFLDDLAQKTRRGQVARLKQGRIAGGKCYGYDVIATIDDRGKRAINEAEAAVVKRIFEEYANGATTTEVAKGLKS